MTTKKKVCLVTSLHEANDGRIFQRIGKSLIKKYDVYLVAPNTETRVLDSINIVGVSLPDINHRIQRWMSLGKLLPVLCEIDADVYHFHDPELMRLGLKMKKRGKIIIFDSHEDVVNQIQNKGFIPKPLRKSVAKLYSLYERSCLRHYDALVSVTGFIVDRLKKINASTYQITNFPKFENRTIVERKWERTICFAGLLSEDWMLSKIINILPELNVKLLMAGFYATEEYLNQLKCNTGWNNVVFYGTLPHDSVLDIYNESSIGMAIESYTNPNVGYRVGSLGVTKIPDYMASGLPIIVSDSEVWGQIIRKYKCGIVVNNPEDQKEIESAISFILDNPDEARKMSENSLKATKEFFNWGTQENVLFEMYNCLLGS